MSTNVKRICLILCVCLLAAFFVACNGGSATQETTESTNVPDFDTTVGVETDATESESTEKEEEPLETEIVDDVVCFADYTRSSRTYYDAKANGDIAVSFTIPSGQIKELYLNLTDINGYTKVNFDVNLYSFTGKYDATVKTEPIYYERITSTMRTYVISLPDGLVKAGDYLLVVSYVEPEAVENGESETATDSANVPSTETQLHSKVIVDNCWVPKTFPAEYVQYSLKSYTNGSLNKRTAICGGFLIEHPQVVDESESSTEERQPIEYRENTAKVILLGGQSNATGSSLVSLLSKNVSSEKNTEYANGYENVQILYTSGSCSGGIHYPNVNQEFCATKAGQGYRTSNFGPELGLAEYLNETYPDETFYIIKYAIGGSGLYAHWNPDDETRNQCLVEFKEKVDLGLSLLEDQGLDPVIVGFLWMQGESDASTVMRAHAYYELQSHLVDYIREEYAFYAPIGGIPFIDATISNSGMWASWYLLNQEKLKYSRTSNLNYLIDTNENGLTTLYENNDIAHYDSMSMIRLGRLFGIELEKAINLS